MHFFLFQAPVLSKVEGIMNAPTRSLAGLSLKSLLVSARLCVLMLLAVAAGQVQSQPQGEVADMTAVYVRAQSWLDQNLSQANKTLPLRMEVTVGELDRRLRLAPCSQIEPYIPPGTRLWGSSRLGLRCVQGQSRWNVFLPITVRAYGPAWVIKGDVAQGALLAESDLMPVEVDWAAQSSPIVANLQDAMGKTAVRHLTTGQALRQDMVRSTQVFQAGAQVNVVAQGAGFEISTSAQAISAGVVGETARVRMDNGRIIVGQVLDNHTVRLSL